MPLVAVSTLANQKGFALIATREVNRYRLVDRYNGLPQLNMPDGLLSFSLPEAAAFLEPLRDRQRTHVLG